MQQAKKILIVDDEVDIVSVLSDILSDYGFQIISANNGEDGLKMALEEHPDLILLDIIMPKMDGLEMLDCLRKDTRGCDIPVIILSNFGDSEKIFKALRGKAFDYLVKSDWKIEGVVKKIKEVLRIEDEA